MNGSVSSAPQCRPIRLFITPFFLYQPREHYSSFPQVFNSLYLIFTLLGLTGNLISVIVLIRLRKRSPHEYANLRGLLISLSAAEVGFCLSVAIYVVFDVIDSANLAGGDQCNDACHYVKLVSFLLLDCLLSFRNWCVVLIAGCRCEAIIKPLQSLARGPLSSRRKTLFLSCLLVTAGAISIVKGLNIQTASSCRVQDVNATTINDVSDPTVALVLTLSAFSFQRGLPTVIILGTTGAVVTVMIADRNRIPDTQAVRIRRGISRRASRTVVSLTTIFILFEGCFFIYTAIDYSGVVEAMHRYDVDVEMANRAFVVADSLCNAFIYVLSNRFFKRELFRLFGSWQLPLGQRNPPPEVIQVLR